MADTKLPQSPIERAAAWAAADDNMAIDAEGRLVVSGDPPLAMGIAADDERLTLTHRGGAAPTGHPAPGRGTLVHAEVNADTGEVSLSTWVYLDGLNRQTFSTAVAALVSAVDTMGVSAPAIAAPEVTAEHPAVEEPEPTREMPAVWAATHSVPTGGTRAWADPDPSHEPIATLEGRVRLSIAERRGDWARVVGSNGWTGWVDARVLEPLTAETTKAGTNPAFRLRTLPAVGAALIGLSTFLPWVGAGTGTVNAFDVSARFLVDYNGAGAPDLGWVVIAVAVIVLALAAARSASSGLLVLAGIAAIAVAVLFATQLYRGITDSGGTFSDVMDIIKFAPLLTVAGGVLAIVGARK